MKKKEVKLNEIIYIPRKVISEKLQGEVVLDEIKFPKSLGEEHPFNFLQLEGLYKKFGYVTSAIDKHVDFVVGTDFRVKCPNDEKSEQILNNWIRDSNFRVILREWLREAFVKGNGFIEIDTKTGELRVLNANYMYIERNRKGELLGYNQYFGKIDKSFNLNKIIPFSVNQIAHLPFSKIGDNAYGIGLVYPALAYIDYVLHNDKDMHHIISRKAGTPYQIKVGTAEEPAKPSDLTALGSKLEYLNNMQEWVTDHRVEIKAIDFGNLSEKFVGVLEHDMDMLIYIFQIPEVLMGKGNIPEGLAQVQMDAWNRRIKSIQASIEPIIEEKILRIILNNQGRNADIEFEWNLPSEKDINEKIDRIQRLMATFGISNQMKCLLELELAKLMNLEDDYLPTPEEVANQEAQNKANLQKQFELEIGKVKSEKPESQERKKEEAESQPKIPEHIHESLDILNDKPLTEWVNFNYQDYIKSILKEIDKDNFENLKALTESDIDLGLLSESDINKLKIVLKDGFKKEKSISQIAKDIKDNINIQDRYRINEEGNKVLSLSKEERPISIARTETLRMSRIGAIKQVEDLGYTQVSWAATVSDRTCDKCLNLNGQIMSLNEYLNKRDMIHPLCRCSFITITK